MEYKYKNLPVLSKVKIGEKIYYLKDDELRALVDGFKGAVNYDVAEAIVDGNMGLATADAVHAYVTQYVTDITGGAMKFLGVKDALPESGNPGDVVIVETAEYVYADGKWNLYGDEGVYATIAGVKAAYVQKALTIAGIDLQNAITADELKTALGLGALAFQNSASGSITVVTGVSDTEYTPAGGVEVVLGQTPTAMASTGTFTPAGDVTGNVTAAGTVAIARDDANGVAVSGTVSAPTITVTPATAQVQHIDSVGTLPSYTAAEYTAPSVTEVTAPFASEGVVAAIDDADAEMLVFSAADTADALIGTGFKAGSYRAARFDAGSLPALGEAQTVVTGITKAEASAPTFTGDKFGATFAGSEVAITASFAGTEGKVSVSGNYDRAKVQSATFSGTKATISHKVVTGPETVTVK